jgi:hypothetical protein
MREPFLCNGSVNGYGCNNRGTDENGAFYWVRVRGYKEGNWGNQMNSLRESVRKRGSSKGDAIQRGHDSGS